MAPLLLKPTLGQKTLPPFLAVCLSCPPTGAFYSLFPSLFFLSLAYFLSSFSSSSFFLIDHALVIHMDFVFDETKLVMPIVILWIMRKFVQNIGRDGHHCYFKRIKSCVQYLFVTRLNHNVTKLFYISNYSEYDRHNNENMNSCRKRLISLRKSYHIIAQLVQWESFAQ